MLGRVLGQASGGGGTRMGRAAREDGPDRPWASLAIGVTLVAGFVVAAVGEGALGFAPGAPSAAGLMGLLLAPGGVLQLVGCLLALALVGPAVEERLGAWPLAGVYVGLGLGSAALYALVAAEGAPPLVGPSSAVAGLCGATLGLFWRDDVRLLAFVPSTRGGVPVAAPLVALAAALVAVVLGLVGAGASSLVVAVQGVVLGLGAAVGAGLRVATGDAPADAEPEAEADQAPSAPSAPVLAWLPTATPDEPLPLVQARAHVAAGRRSEARQLLRAAWRAPDADPRLADALWQGYVADGYPADGADVLHAAAERFAAEGKAMAALDRWQRVVDATGDRGPPALRLALAEALLEGHRDAARDFLVELTELPPPDPVGARAAERLANITWDETERVRWMAIAQRHRPRDHEAIARSKGQRILKQSSGIGLRLVKVPSRVDLAAAGAELAPPSKPQPAPATDPGLTVTAAAPSGPAVRGPAAAPSDAPAAPDVPTETAAPPGEPEPALLVALRGEAMVVRIALGAARTVPFERVSRVTCGAVGEGARRVELFEIALRAADGDPARRLRVDTLQLRAARLMGDPELSADEAWRRLAAHIAQRARAPMSPTPAHWATWGLPPYGDLAAFEATARA